MELCLSKTYHVYCFVTIDKGCNSVLQSSILSPELAVQLFLDVYIHAECDIESV